MKKQGTGDKRAKVKDPNKLTIGHKIFGSKPNDGEVQPKEGFAYSVTGFGQNIICSIISAYLTVFMTDAIGYKALWVALLMLFARVFDALNDPIMGSIVDRTRTKCGKCRPYLKWMALPIALCTILCFLPVYPNSPGGFAAISIVYIIWGMVYTVADVPYWGLSTAMSNDTYRRGNLLTVARLLCTLGAGLVTVIVPQVTSNMTKDISAQINAKQELIEKGLENGLDVSSLQSQLSVLKEQMGHDLKWIFFVIAIICVVVAIPMFYYGYRKTVERNTTDEQPPSLGHNLKLLTQNKPLMLIVLSGVLGAARMVFTFTGGYYFAKYVLSDVSFLGMQGDGLFTIITMSIVPGGLIASILVPYFTKKFGKKKTYIWSHLIGGVALLIAYVVGICISRGDYSDVVTLSISLVALFISGIPLGFGNIISYAMIGDTVEYLEVKTGERAEGICFAMQTFINKIGMAVGAFVGVLGYHIAGVEANNAAALDATGKDIMWAMLMLLGAISFIACAIPIFFYKFNEKEQLEAKKILDERKLKKALDATTEK